MEKMQGGKKRELLSQEKKTLQPFMRGPAAVDDESNRETEVGYTESILKLAEVEHNVSSFKYCDHSHITSTNNDIERLFNRAKIVMRAHRKAMKP